MSRIASLVDSDGIQSVFTIDGYPTSIVNGIRRTLISNVRSVAMVAEPHDETTIRILENTSRLNNQFLALRLSLIPVCIPPPEYGGEVNVLNRYEIRLEVTATEPGIRNVTTDDIQVYDKEAKGFLPKRIVEQIFPREVLKNTEGVPIEHRSNPILIVPLKGPHGDKAGEKVNLVASLAVGVGSKHACFNPVSNATYEIEQTDNVLDSAGKRDHSKFHFEVESVTTRRPEMLFMEAVDELIRRLTNSSMDIRTASTSKGKGVHTDIYQDGNDFVLRFVNEDHTLGYILQSYLLQQIKTRTPEMIGDWFIGYRIPHPLTPEMAMRIRVPDEIIAKENPLGVLEVEWVTPALNQAIADLKEIGSKIASVISPEFVKHPLEMLLHTEYRPSVTTTTEEPKLPAASGAGEDEDF